MSSHREAPEISKDPVADSTDLYAFVSPDRPDTVTILANYIPLEAAAGGPNFYEFGTDVRYEINISNSGTARADITYRFDFRVEVRNPETFLYNTGPITSLDSPNWSRRQTFTVTRIRGGVATVLGSNLVSPPVNIGPRSTPDYVALANAAIHTLGSTKVFAGQRAEGFYVDLGSIFDLGALRPFQNLHLIPLPATMGVDALTTSNVHSIALQVPISDLTASGRQPTDPLSADAAIGIWTTASRRRARILAANGASVEQGPFVQVSRLGEPLINEVIIAVGDKDQWNRQPPASDSEFAHYYAHPELAGLLPVLYPGVFPNLAGLTAARADLIAVLLTGIPAGIIPGFQNFTGPTQADLLRLNVAIPPSANPSIFGILGDDLAGFPNGRRVADDIVAIELRAIAGATYPLVAPTFVPDGAALVITDGTTPPPFLDTFPYLNTPHSGFETPSP